MRVFKVKTEWVNDNAFFVRVDQYERTMKFGRWPWSKSEVQDVFIKSFSYASWDSFMSIMWRKHMLGGKSIFEIDSKI